MKKIEVTADMHDRILANLNNLDVDNAPSKVTHISRYRYYFSLAACLALLIIGAAVIHYISNSPGDNLPPVQGGVDIVEYGSAKELSDAVGFAVKEIQAVPFEVEAVQYTAYWSRLAKIQYTGLENAVSLGMATGDEDVSGDFTQYPAVKTRSVDGYSVTIKGEGEGYVLAVWQVDGYSYYLRFEQAVPEQEILSSVQSVKGTD